MPATREQFLEEVKRLAEEYANEAEHQDGEEYWTNSFDTVDQAMEDFTWFLAVTYDIHRE